MLKAEAEELLREAADCIGEFLRLSRFHLDPGKKDCRHCERPEGAQHLSSCPCWPLILWRQKYNDARQVEQPDREDMSVMLL